MKLPIFDVEDLQRRPFFSLTAEEMCAVLIESLLKDPRFTPQSDVKTDDKKLVYGLRGLSQLMNCSNVTAQRIKNSGKLDGSFSQIGRKIIFDENKVLKALEKTKTKKGLNHGK